MVEIRFVLVSFVLCFVLVVLVLIMGVSFVDRVIRCLMYLLIDFSFLWNLIFVSFGRFLESFVFRFVF